MVVRRTVGVAALLLGVVGVTAAPEASAAPPQSGAPCSPTDTVSADGTLSCSHRALTWMHKRAR
jgi:hypothetical protein